MVSPVSSPTTKPRDVFNVHCTVRMNLYTVGPGLLATTGEFFDARSLIKAALEAHVGVQANSIVRKGRCSTRHSISIT